VAIVAADCRNNPIFASVELSLAVKIARDWTMPARGKADVSRFPIDKKSLDIKSKAGVTDQLEYWMPDEQEAFNEAP